MNQDETILEPDEKDFAEAEKAVERLHRDLKNLAADISDRASTFLVRSYYSIQEERKKFNNQARELQKEGMSSELIEWFARQNRILEGQMKNALYVYANGQPSGRWMMSLYGVGPVMAAGFLAHLDIERSPTAGGFWRFAGLSPDQKWEKGEKRPWNADLKVLCWKFGDCMVKFSAHPQCYYGKIYQNRKEIEVKKNEEFAFSEQAFSRVDTVGKATTAHKWYAQGKLPPAHVHQRAKRYAVKMFLSHLHEVMHWHAYGTAPPNPYPIEHLGHVHKLEPPHITEIKRMKGHI